MLSISLLLGLTLVEVSTVPKVVETLLIMVLKYCSTVPKVVETFLIMWGISSINLHTRALIDLIQRTQFKQ